MSDDESRATTSEPRYTLDELKGDRRRAVGASRAAIAGAAALAPGRTKFTVNEMQRLVARFQSREVRS